MKASSDLQVPIHSKDLYVCVDVLKVYDLETAKYEKIIYK